tara:strand:- start:3522 stop:3785 length:264 start_codon:yes stop_codon:yes gene_type:complete
MSKQNLEIQTWVDPFTSDLFFNANHDHWDAVTTLGNEYSDLESTEEEIFEALVKDAEEFIEVIAQHFSGISIDHEPEAYARNFLERL